MTTPKAHQYAMITNADGQTFMIDCLKSDGHNWESDISDSPSESGADTSDNIRNKSLVVTMECIVSNDPLDPETLKRSSVTEPAQDAYDFLIGIRDAKKPVMIRTSLQSYERMAMQSLSMPRKSSDGDCLVVDVTWKEMRTVENTRFKRVAIPIAQGPTTTNGATKDSPVTRVRVYRKQIGRGNGFVYWWYDESIGGWRQYAYRLNQIATNYQNGADPSELSEEVKKSTSKDWRFRRNRPFGVTSDEWDNHRKTDEQYRLNIDTAWKLFGPGNKYDLFGNHDGGFPEILSGRNYFIAFGHIDEEQKKK